MPIRPENRKRYPKNWKEIREAILKRAKNHCEKCGVENHRTGCRCVDCGSFFYWPMRPGEMHWACCGGNHGKYLKIVLTIAHLDHTPENCGHDNLKALCQRCHLRYDAEHHRESRAKNRAARKALKQD